MKLWLCALVPAAILGLLPILVPHGHDGGAQIARSVAIFVGATLVMRYVLMRMTPDARGNRDRP
jgi:hypothetical protein